MNLPRSFHLLQASKREQKCARRVTPCVRQGRRRGTGHLLLNLSSSARYADDWHVSSGYVRIGNCCCRAVPHGFVFDTLEQSTREYRRAERPAIAQCKLGLLERGVTGCCSRMQPRQQMRATCQGMRIQLVRFGDG